MAARRTPSSTRTRPAQTGLPSTPDPGPVEVSAPDYSYVADIIHERNRLYGTVAISVGATSQGLTTGMATNQQRRSFDVRTREFRLRRQLRVDPRIPPNYRKTTQVIRAGQAMLADLALRIPALLTTKPMQVKAHPHDDSDAGAEAATKREEWTHAVLLGQEGQRAVLDQGGTSVWRDWIDNLVNTGVGNFTLTARADRWSDTADGFPRQGDFDDDGPDVPRRYRRTGPQKYLDAIEQHRRTVMPFVMEHVDPLMVYIREDDEGTEDEAIVVGLRPARQTLAAHGLVPVGALGQTHAVHGPDIAEGKSGNKYVAGPSGFGRPYPLRDWPTGVTFLEGVETVTYYCSARRAAALGLFSAEKKGAPTFGTTGTVATDASVGTSGTVGTTGTVKTGVPVTKPGSVADFDPAMGVWAQFVDGVLVQSGPLLGPAWHPLPVFRAFGLSTAMPDPAYRGIPASLALLELADALDQIFTMKMHVAFWSAWPAILEEDKTGGGPGATGLPQDVLIDPEQLQRPPSGQTKERRTIEPAGFYPVPAGKTWRHFVLPAEAMVHLQSLEQDVRAMLDLLGVPSVFRGAGAQGSSGYAIAQLTLAARALYDPVIENATACITQAVKYLWWQLWKRFPDGVPAYAAPSADGTKGKGWITLKPRDIAPTWQSPERPGTPFLSCSVTADPLLPMDELQLEQRGINAQGAGLLSEDTVRDKYFKVQSPEMEAARVMADKVMNDPVTIATFVTRGQVRAGLLMPKLAPLMLAAKLGIDPAMAAEQLAYVEGLPPEMAQQAEAAAAQAQATQQIAAGGMAPGSQPVPGAPIPPPIGVPGLPPAAPVPPAPPPISPGQQPGPGPAPIPGGLGARGGMPMPQPSTASRMAQGL